MYRHNFKSQNTFYSDMKQKYSFSLLISCFLLILIMLSCVSPLHAQKVEATIKGIKSSKGHIAVMVFTDSKSFDDKKPAQKLKYPKKNMVNGNMKFVLDLQPGVYGISLLDDENDNGKMDYNMVHLPKEGFAFSDYYLSGMSKPVFEDFKFEVSPTETKKIEMKIRYVL